MTATAAGTRLIPLVRRGPRPACVLLPGAGGGLQPYLQLAGVLGRAYNVYGIQAAGLQPDEEPEETVAAMADSALRVLDAARLVPVLIFGWSLGGVVGWETCVRYAARGIRPDLALLDSSPLPAMTTPDEDARLVDRIAGMLGPQADAQTVQRLRRALVAQVAAGATYRTEQAYTGRVLLISCTDESAERAPAVAAWRTLAPDLREAQLDAGHYTALDPVHLPALVAALTPFLPADLSAPTDPSLESAP